MKTQAKLNEKYMHAWYKQVTASYQFFYFLFFLKSAFASADLIFYNFLEPHSAFSAKNIDYMKKKLSQIFMFNEFIQTPPTPLTTKIY